MPRRVTDIVTEGQVLGVVGGVLASVPLPADTDDQTAAQVPFTPAGGIAATDVQAALVELDTEKTTKDPDGLTLAEQAAAPATPASGFGRLYAKATGLFFKGDDGVEIGPLGGGSTSGGGVTFKRTVISGSGDMTVTSATRVALDATDLPYLTLDGLVVGDVVECTLSVGGAYVSSFGLAIDFEVDQPTSANTYVAPNNDRGCGTHEATGRNSFHIVGLFTVTEAGSHGFQPVAWMPGGGTGTVGNAASGANDTAITFMVKKLGAPTA